MNKKILEKINQRQRQILVHSFIYYQLSDNIISDYTFDRFCIELVHLQSTYKEEAKASAHYKDFIDFDGSTGFDLPFNTPKIHALALFLIDYDKEMKQGD